MWPKPRGLEHLVYVIKSPQSSMILLADHVLRAVINARLSAYLNLSFELSYFCAVRLHEFPCAILSVISKWKHTALIQVSLEKDPAPYLTARQEQAVQVLSSNKAPFWRYPECFLALVALSPTADPRKVQAVKVQKGEEQVTLLESVKHCFVSLDAPVAVYQASGSGSGAGLEASAPSAGKNVVAEKNVIPVGTYVDLIDPEDSKIMVLRKEMPTPDSPEKAKRKKLSKQATPLPAKRNEWPPLLLGTSLAAVHDSGYRAGGDGVQLHGGSFVSVIKFLSLAADKSLLSSEVVSSSLKSAVLQKDTDISLLDSRASYLKSALDDSQAACDEARNLISSLSSERDGLASEVSTLHSAFRDFKEKMEAQQEAQAQELYNRVAELEAHVMDVSGRLEGEFYPAYLTTLAGRRWLLTHGMELAMVKCLKSPEYQGILGHALGRAVDYGMQEGLAAGHEHGVAGTPLSAVVAYNPETAESNYLDAVRALEEADFPLVHLLKSKKDSGMDEVLDCFLLDGPLADLPEAAHLQPCLEQLSVPIYHADVNAVVGETSLSFALLNVHTRAEGARRHASALRQLMVDIVSHPLSSQNLLGEASTSAVAPCVEDLDTDEDLGSVVCMPKLEDPRFEILP
ncbi:hypothetical protein Tco_0668699 [Tanacetum coccineum]